MHNFRY